MVDRILLGKIMSLILTHANDLKQNAAYSGAWSDGGASDLQLQVSMYRHGMEETIPPEWRGFRELAEKMMDPEYNKYLELKKKFGE